MSHEGVDMPLNKLTNTYATIIIVFYSNKYIFLKLILSYIHNIYIALYFMQAVQMRARNI